MAKDLKDSPKYKTNALSQSLQERQSLQLEGTVYDTEKFSCLSSEDSDNMKFTTPTSQVMCVAKGEVFIMNMPSSTTSGIHPLGN